MLKFNILSPPDDTVQNIILAGHSFGSFAIQHLAVLLTKQRIDTHKIFIIGSGCYTNNILNDTDLELFLCKYRNKYRFVILGLMHTDGKIHLDSLKYEPSLNPLTTHFLVCLTAINIHNASDLDNIYNCSNISYESIPENISSDIYFYGPKTDKMHIFDIYRNFYLTYLTRLTHTEQ